MNKKPSKRARSTLHYSKRALFFRHHLHAFWQSLLRMGLSPFATLLTVAVIGVSMALPAGLLVLLQNAQSIMNRWEASMGISLFLKVDTPEEVIQSLMTELKTMPMVSEVRYISPEEGLKTFENSTGFQGVLKGLPGNPLPPVIEVKPTFKNALGPALKDWMKTLEAHPWVNGVEVDTQWVQRLYAIVTLVKRGVSALGILLALGVVLVIGNTLRLLIQNHREEIKVFILLGASQGFIRRPFLYAGILYGLLGAMMAWAFVDLILWALKKPMTVLASLYQSSFSLTVMPLSSVLWLLFLGGTLGLLAAWMSVNPALKVLRN